MYQVILTKRALKDFQNLTTDTKNLIKEKLLQLSSHPFQNTRKLINSQIGNYRFRAGDYRIIFDLKDTLLIVLRIGHRKDIYK